MEPTTNERITATAATDTAVSEQETLELQAERLIIGTMADRISQLEQALETCQIALRTHSPNVPEDEQGWTSYDEAALEAAFAALEAAYDQLPCVCGDNFEICDCAVAKVTAALSEAAK